MQIALVAACDENSGIGKGGKIPWDNKADMKHFKELTISGDSNAVIMGRLTFESIGRPLPGRLNIIISRGMQAGDHGEYVVCTSLLDGMITCREKGVTCAWICGGQQVYEDAINRRQELGLSHCFLTNIKGNFNCDTYFPELPAVDWFLQSETQLDCDTEVRMYCCDRSKDCQ